MEPNKTQKPEGVYTISEFARLHGMTRYMVGRMILAGDAPDSIQISDRWYFNRAVADRWVCPEKYRAGHRSSALDSGVITSIMLERKMLKDATIAARAEGISRSAFIRIAIATALEQANAAALERANAAIESTPELEPIIVDVPFAPYPEQPLLPEAKVLDLSPRLSERQKEELDALFGLQDEEAVDVIDLSAEATDDDDDLF